MRPTQELPASRGGRERSQVAELVDLMRRNADFRRLFLASVVSFLGDWFALVAVSGLVKELTGREGSTALVFAAEVLPIFLFAPLAGVLADRIDRKRLMIASAVARTVPALGLLVASLTGNVALAYIGVATISALAAFYEPVVSAVVPNVVDREDLSLAQTTIGSVWGTMLFLGAAIGGLVAATLGRNTSFVINALTFLTAAVLVWRIRRPFSEGHVPAPASVLTHLGEVWRFARPRKAVRSLMITKAGVGVGNGVVGLLPVFALDRFGAGDAGIGVLFAMRGLGALVGPYVGRHLYRGDGRRLIRWCGISIVAYSVGYVFLPFSGTLVVAATFVFLAHVGGGNQWVSSTTGLQLATPDLVRGRVLALDFALATLAMGTSAILAGFLAEVVGIDAATWGLAGVAAIYGLGWLIWTRDLWQAEEDPLGVPSPAGAETGPDLTHGATGADLDRS